MAILAIESSCDETAAAVIALSGELKASIVRSQQKVHANYGGVVPEIASRSHCVYMLPIIEEALAQAAIDYAALKGIAVTAGPGLLGSLLVGLASAKALALGLNIPLIAVDHLEAHIAAAYIGEARPDFSRAPVMALVISGGHTALYLWKEVGELHLLGNTVDDAVGEAFDKVAAQLQLGYPGGPVIDKIAGAYQGALLPLPIPMQHSKDLQFSFSGLKTAVVQHLKLHPALNETSQAQVAASFQAAAIEALATKLAAALRRNPNVQEVVVCGGVAANQGLRRRLQAIPEIKTRTLKIPPPKYCTDNAAMIARLGLDYFQRQQFSSLDTASYTSFSRSPVCRHEKTESPQ